MVKGEDPTVEVSVLESKWVEGCPTVYVGKATSLRKRLRQYRDFGRGRPVGHWGGRYIWQLAEASELVVGWQSTAQTPRTVESELLAAFRSEFGRLPFANINN